MEVSNQPILNIRSSFLNPLGKSLYPTHSFCSSSINIKAHSNYRDSIREKTRSCEQWRCLLQVLDSTQLKKSLFPSTFATSLKERDQMCTGLSRSSTFTTWNLGTFQVHISSSNSFNIVFIPYSVLIDHLRFLIQLGS